MSSTPKDAAGFDTLAGEEDRAARRRLAAAAERRESTLTAAHRWLASVFDRSSPSRHPSPGGPDDVLRAACRAVGETLGLSFQAPADALAGAAEHPHHRLDHLCRASRVRWRQVTLDGAWWRDDVGPLLAFRRQPTDTTVGEAVAILPTGPTRYVLYDPRDGRRHDLDAEVAATLHPTAFTFYRPLPPGPVGLGSLLRLALLGQRRDLLTLAGCGVLAGLLALLVPLFTDRIFGDVILDSDRPQLAQIVLALVAAALASAAFHLTRSFAVLRLTGRLDGVLQPAVIDRLLDLPIDLYRQLGKGDLALRALGIDTLRNLLLGNILTAALSLVFSVFSLGLLFYYDLRLAIAGSMLVLVLLAVVVVTGLLQVAPLRRFYAHQGEVASLLLNVLQGIGKLRVAGAEVDAYAEWARRFAEQRRESIAAQRLAVARLVFAAGYPVIASLVLFAVMGLFVRGSLPTSGFLAFSAAFGQFQAAALTLIPLITGFLQAIPVVERLRPIFDATPEVAIAGPQAPPLRGAIEMSHVCFRYEEKGPLILDDVSIRIDPGELVALVGASGSGKSTCLRLLLGFESPSRGSITYDGQELGRLDVQSVRRQLGVVLQDGKPFPGSLYRNIIGSHVHLGQDAAWQAARLANLEDEVRALPMGMHTLLSENASTFSGGQRQRLLIARAVVARPPILFFDEATSSLDNVGQEKVQRAIEQLEVSRLVLAHRLSTVRNADRIYVLDRGRVVEVGTYGELMAAGGVFFQLARRQLAV